MTNCTESYNLGLQTSLACFVDKKKEASLACLVEKKKASLACFGRLASRVRTGIFFDVALIIQGVEGRLSYKV